MRAPVPNGVEGSSGDLSVYVGEYIPKSVEEVRFIIERVRLKFGVSAPPLEATRLPLLGLSSRQFGGLDRREGVEGSESEGGVGVSNGRLGMGRMMGGGS